MISAEEFINELRDNKETSLIILACSKNKRSDVEVERILNKSNHFEDQTISFDYGTLRLINNFRNCTETKHDTALKFSKMYPVYLRDSGYLYKSQELVNNSQNITYIRARHEITLKFSKMYPAYLRYIGRFYKSIWKQGGVEIWRRNVSDNWKVLILSAFYGFLKITDPISNYDLRLSNLNAECKELLPKTLKSIMKENGIKDVYFLTSEEYSEPFRGKLPNFYRVILLDGSGNEIIGKITRIISQRLESCLHTSSMGETPC